MTCEDKRRSGERGTLFCERGRGEKKKETGKLDPQSVNGSKRDSKDSVRKGPKRG